MYLTKNNKSPFYQIIYERDEKPTSKSTKTKIKSEALKFLSEFEQHLKTKPKETNLSLFQFRDEYKNYISGIRSESYKRTVNVAFKQFINFIENPQLKNITIKSIDSFISEVYSRAPQSALTYYRILKAAFNKALQWNYLQNNPFSKIKPPRVKVSFPVFITDMELELICNNTKEPYLRDLFIFGFYTGLRLGEILTLDWKSISLTERIIKVEHSETFTTKSKKERIVPINKKLFEVLSTRYPTVRKINQIDYVFYRIPGVKLNVDFVSKKFKKSVRKAGLNDKIHFHSLRHSFASNLVQRGCSLLTVQKLLGHSDFRVTQIYSHLQNSNLFDAVELLSNSESLKQVK
ncbi:MAG: tyrosine-type recombinase/integrase [Melioribacteraceae bacterium]|nr:tyrosine-type recombinase/integrase [Melioribacteraceae bacterium]MCF8354503.1 tyrosine-type recombinase/integrase [Melioribacteraceae bacterium]MCF8394272.1 tyrosine-type recombinase/integrase [Melioribacteraceae bacterium]MCF8418172.1 tyrosine-type recombinase/integrase [Melioribacteraceae bacterium]